MYYCKSIDSPFTSHDLTFSRTSKQRVKMSQQTTLSSAAMHSGMHQKNQSKSTQESAVDSLYESCIRAYSLPGSCHARLPEWERNLNATSRSA
jgi:hypothetical protein